MGLVPTLVYKPLLKLLTVSTSLLTWPMPVKT